MMPITNGLGASEGAGPTRTYGRGSGRERSAGGDGHARAGNPELGKRSASTPQVRMRCDCNLGNGACECQSATKGDSFTNRTARKV
eukprot:6191925-Pleurochrysis_carterae.AAC.5